MKTSLSLSPAAQIETECLVAVVLDRGEKDKTDVFVSATDKAVQQAAADVLSSGDVSGKNFEMHWIHGPAGLKAKRLLLIGGGKANKFTASEL
ncbi:MAG TPA: M17 family peptidase N-terminal domain-containing protein, partial [Terriglobales bacterium]|nr:M17 family peptidase N-terminal domain-containing protein [Terriglobales bacterium]